MNTPSIGRILAYYLTEEDAEAISRRRTTSEEIKQATVRTQWSKGAQAHIGNPVDAGMVFPMIVTAVYQNEVVSGQVFLDGTDVLWVTSINSGFSPGTWHWPFEL